VFLAGVICHLSVVIEDVTSSNSDPLRAPLWALLATFGAFASSLGWCPSAAARDHLQVTLDEDGLDHFFTRGMLGCNVKQLLYGLWLFTPEFMHYDLTTSARPECRDDISVTDLGEFMPLPRKSSDVLPEGFDQLLLTALQIPGVVRSHVCALEVISEIYLRSSLLSIMFLDKWSSQALAMSAR
jgi:hypothetical protein